MKQCILLLFTDAVSYIIKIWKILKIFYIKMMNVMYIAHASNRRLVKK